MLNEVSIIIPLASDETEHEKLVEQLKKTEAEILPIFEGGSRAKNMNMGAEKAQNPFLWFLHADSVLTDNNLKSLEKSLQDKPDALHYFDLLFNNDGPPLMRLNTWGANLRSRIFGVPYGDQGFCISKHMFEKAERYREDLPYAEDLMFVWQARQAGIKLKRVKSPLLTSARKYKERGWLKITLLYQSTWIKMSIPQAIKLIKIKMTS